MTIKGLAITIVQILVITGIQSIIGGSSISFAISLAMISLWTANSLGDKS